MNVKNLLAIFVVASLANLSVGEQPKKPRFKITPKMAAAVAVKKYPGKLAAQPTLEHEEGQWQYEVLVRYRKKLLEVDVSATTGRITDTEVTSAAEERREAKGGKG